MCHRLNTPTSPESMERARQSAQSSNNHETSPCLAGRSRKCKHKRWNKKEAQQGTIFFEKQQSCHSNQPCSTTFHTLKGHQSCAETPLANSLYALVRIGEGADMIPQSIPRASKLQLNSFHWAQLPLQLTTVHP